MKAKGEVKAQFRKFNKLEETFEDRDGDVFNIVLYFGPMHELKNKLKTLETQGVDVHSVHTSHFHYFLSIPNHEFSIFCCMVCVQLILVGIGYNGF